MAEEKVSNKNNLSENDTFDINELAALNQDISLEMIENLQAKISNETASEQNSTIFEEKTDAKSTEATQKNVNVDINSNIDDNFVKKYRAKLQKASAQAEKEDDDNRERSNNNPDLNNPETDAVQKEEVPAQNVSANEDIAVLSNGNITEKEVTQEYLDYSNYLDLTDDNVNYSKYVVYISPDNAEFIESLTVKERKNLINDILKEQRNIAISKKRVQKFKTVIIHLLIATLIVALVVPLTYSIINNSMEITIDNYRRSQSLFQVLYREHGKIKINKTRH